MCMYRSIHDICIRVQGMHVTLSHVDTQGSTDVHLTQLLNESCTQSNSNVSIAGVSKPITRAVAFFFVCGYRSCIFGIAFFS